MNSRKRSFTLLISILVVSFLLSSCSLLNQKTPVPSTEESAAVMAARTLTAVSAQNTALLIVASSTPFPSATITMTLPPPA